MDTQLPQRHIFCESQCSLCGQNWFTVVHFELEYGQTYVTQL